MQVVSSGLIHDAHVSPQDSRACTFTTVTQTHDGTLFAAFRLGSERESLDGREAVFASVDGGETWELRFDGRGRGSWGGVPGEVKTLVLTELTPGTLTATGLWIDRSYPDLPWINPHTAGLLPMRIFHTTSTDGGYTWGPRREMETRPHVAASPSSCAVFPLASGVLTQVYETWKAYSDHAPPAPGVYLRCSYDDGNTWPEYVTIAKHPENALFYWDMRFANHPTTGEFAAMFWTHDPHRGMDRDIHIAWGTPDGRSWTEPVPTGLAGQHCQPLSLGGEEIAAVYASRSDPAGIVVLRSSDFGRSWDRTDRLVLYRSGAGEEAGVDREREMEDLWDDMVAWRFGHPRAVLLPDGDLLVVFYAGDDQYKSAHWARVRL